MAILNCPGCGRGGLRVPDGRRGRVTCPSCGAEWFYPEALEVSDVEFRCAHSGARFLVQFSRRSPLHHFVIQGVKQAPSRESKAPKNPAQSPSEERLPSAVGSAPELPRPKSTNLLTRLFGRFPEVVASTPSGPAAKSIAQADGQKLPTPSTHDAKEYNWSSFFCPYCNAAGFVRCHAGHFACDGTVEIRSGRRFHQCFCGSAGFIEGVIKTIEANERVIDVASSSQVSAISTKEGLPPALGPPANKPESQLLRGDAAKGR